MNIRKYFENVYGVWCPGAPGVTLHLEQFNNLKLSCGRVAQSEVDTEENLGRRKVIGKSNGKIYIAKYSYNAFGEKLFDWRREAVFLTPSMWDKFWNAEFTFDRDFECLTEVPTSSPAPLVNDNGLKRKLIFAQNDNYKRRRNDSEAVCDFPPRNKECPSQSNNVYHYAQQQPDLCDEATSNAIAYYRRNHAATTGQ